MEDEPSMTYDVAMSMCRQLLPDRSRKNRRVVVIVLWWLSARLLDADVASYAEGGLGGLSVWWMISAESFCSFCSAKHKATKLGLYVGIYHIVLYSVHVVERIESVTHANIVHPSFKNTICSDSNWVTDSIILCKFSFPLRLFNSECLCCSCPVDKASKKSKSMHMQAGCLRRGRWRTKREGRLPRKLLAQRWYSLLMGAKNMQKKGRNVCALANSFRQGAKVKRCSSEGCAIIKLTREKFVVKGGVCNRHGAKFMHNNAVY